MTSTRTCPTWWGVHWRHWLLPAASHTTRRAGAWHPPLQAGACVSDMIRYLCGWYGACRCAAVAMDAGMQAAVYGSVLCGVLCTECGSKRPKPSQPAHVTAHETCLSGKHVCLGTGVHSINSTYVAAGQGSECPGAASMRLTHHAPSCSCFIDFCSPPFTQCGVLLLPAPHHTGRVHQPAGSRHGRGGGAAGAGGDSRVLQLCSRQVYNYTLR